MAVTVPPPPYKTPIINQGGTLSNPWANWFRDLFSRIGGTVALSNTELEEEGSLTSVNGRIDDLEDLTDDHTAQIANLEDLVGTGDGLDQGRQL